MCISSRRNLHFNKRAVRSNTLQPHTRDENWDRLHTPAGARVAEGRGLSPGSCRARCHGARCISQHGQSLGSEARKATKHSGNLHTTPLHYQHADLLSTRWERFDCRPPLLQRQFLHHFSAVWSRLTCCDTVFLQLRYQSSTKQTLKNILVKRNLFHLTVGRRTH